MPDLQKLHENKEKIISIIQTQGPSFPGRISRATGLPPLFVSAFLSELVSDRRLKLSDMKVGSSPLYFIEGQEQGLENFVNHLNHKEKETFLFLKNSQVLEDEKQQPATRVALRKIKDFAIPVNVRVGDEIKLFWRFFLIQEEQVKEKVRFMLTGKSERTQKPKAQKPTQQTIVKPAKIKTDKIKTPKKLQPSEFANNIKDYLAGKDIEILSIESEEKKREFISKIRNDELFGKQEYLLIAKDKKKVTTNDLTIALQQSQTQKMPALFLSPGELDKKAKSYLIEWKNLIKFERVKV